MSHHILTKEVEYKLVPGYDGAYRVGDDGSVWSRKVQGKPGCLEDWKLLGGMKTSHGYRSVGLHENDNCKYWYVHRLVISLFVGPCSEGQECRHLNGNGLDNRLSNLVWGTSKENSADIKRHGNTAHGDLLGRLKTEDVVEIKILISQGNAYKAIARRFNCGESTIRNIAYENSWSRVPWPEGFEPKNRRNKLTAVDVKKIKEDIRKGEKLGRIAEKFEVTYSTIWYIAKGRTWTTVS